MANSKPICSHVRQTKVVYSSEDSLIAVHRNSLDVCQEGKSKFVKSPLRETVPIATEHPVDAVVCSSISFQ